MAFKKSSCHSSCVGNLGVVTLLGSVIECATRSGIISSETPISARPAGNPISAFSFSISYARSEDSFIPIALQILEYLSPT